MIADGVLINERLLEIIHGLFASGVRKRLLLANKAITSSSTAGPLRSGNFPELRPALKAGGAHANSGRSQALFRNGTIAPRTRVTRRRVLQGLGAASASLVAARALRPGDDPLQQLIQQNQNSDVGQGFDSASRTIKMPKASLPTLTPANVPTTEGGNRALRADRGERRLAAVPTLERVRLGRATRLVLPLRTRLTLAATSIRARSRTTSTTPMSRRRCGASRRATALGRRAAGRAHLQGAEHPGGAAAEPAQDQSRAAARVRHQGASALRRVQHSGGAARGDRERRRVSRHIAVVGKPDRPSPDINSRSSRSTSIRTGPCRSRSCART
jgi:hypothetical protein